MPTLNVCVEIYMNKKNKQNSNYKYFSSFQKLCQCIIKLQTEIQINQQHNKFKLKNTYRIKEINCQGQNITVSLQKKIVRKIS